MPTALVPPPGYREQTRKRVGRSFLTCKIRNLCSLQDTAKKYFKSLGEHICQIHRLKLPNQEHITNSQNSMIRRQRVYVLKGGGAKTPAGGAAAGAGAGERPRPVKAARDALARRSPVGWLIGKGRRVPRGRQTEPPGRPGLRGPAAPTERRLRDGLAASHKTPHPALRSRRALFTQDE